LLRIRDEARMRIAAYQTLYESSLAFAVRKAILAESEKLELEQKVKLVTQLLPDSSLGMCKPYLLTLPLAA
jgi:dynein light intermediate chain